MQEDEPDGVVDPLEVWQRWAGDPSPRLLHELCANPLVDTLREEEDGPDLRILVAPSRLVIRHAPTLVIAALVVTVLTAQFSPGMAGVGSLRTTPIPAELAALTVVLGFVALLVLSWTELFPNWKEALWASTVYATIAVLLVGVGLATFYSLFGGQYDVKDLGQNVVFTSGFFLALLLAGALSYDTTLRMETLLSRLPELEVVRESDRYEEFLDRQDVKAGSSGSRVLIARAFAFVVVTFFAGVWWYGNGPQNLGSNVMIVFNFFFDFVIAVYLFSFLHFMRGLHLLLREDVPVNPPDTGYSPFHPDGAGGYAPLGFLAMRINYLFILAGVYYVYRLTVVGGRSIPVTGQLNEQILWTVNYLGPIAVYVGVAGLWLYYTFWEMHRQMVRGKRQTREALHTWLPNRHSETIEATADGGRTQLDPRTKRIADAVEPAEVLDRLDRAPVWPVSNRRLYAVVIANLLPIVLSLLAALLR